MTKKYQIGIYVDLPKKLSNKIQQAKQYLHDLRKNDYTQDPHISLYLSAFKKENFELLCNNLRGVLNYLPFVINISQKINRDGDFYYLSVSPKKSFLDLQKLIVSQANRLRNELIREKDLARLKTNFYNSKQTNYVKKYGCARVFNFYEPHITLGNIKNNNSPKEVLSKLKTHIDFKTQNFLVKNITVTLFAQEKLQNPLQSEKIKLEKKIYQKRFVAGGYVIDGNKILLVKNLARGGAIGIPKGKIEKGESPLQAAKREIVEETGYYDLKLINKIGSYSYLYQLKRKKPCKVTIHYYLFVANSIKAKKQKMDSDEKLQAMWVHLAEAEKVVSYLETKKVIRKIIKSLDDM